MKPLSVTIRPTLRTLTALITPLAIAAAAPGMLHATIPTGAELLQNRELQRERIGNIDWIFNREFQLSTAAHLWFNQQVRPVLEADTDEAFIQAARMIVDYVRENPADAMLLFPAGQYFSRAEQFDRAVDVFEQAVHAYPDLRANPGIYTFLARSHMASEDEERRERARPYFVMAMDNPRMLPDVVGFLGGTLYQGEQYTAAEFAFRKATILNPEQERWNTLLADTLRLQDKLATSSAMVQLILANNPETQDLWILLANNYLGRDRIDEAAQIHELLLRMGKATSESLHLLGRIHLNNENFELSYNAHREAILHRPDQDPRDLLEAVRSLSNYGAFPEALGLIDDMREHLERELTPEQEVRLLTAEAEIMIAQGRGEEAVEPLEGILEREPDNARAIMTLARHYERDARQNPQHARRAEELYTRAMDLEDYEVDARIRLSQLHVRLRNWVQARDLLAEAVTLRPDEHVERYLEQIEQRVRVFEATGR